MRGIKVLVACEESQRVCVAFREKGHEAYSCDIIEPSGGHPEWHIMQDVLPLLNGKCSFKTMDGVEHTVEDRWDMIIAHPPCTYLTLAGNKWFKPEFESRFPERRIQREEAVEFFMKFANADCEKIVIENPVCIMSSRWRKPDQYIEPFMFGDPEKKKNGTMAERSAAAYGNRYRRACHRSLQVWCKRTKMAHGNNAFTKGREKPSAVADFLGHCPSDG